MLPLVAFSDITGVTGELSHGQQIVISGYSFGTKIPAAPLLWDTFEYGSNGDDLSNYPNWTMYGGAGATHGGFISTASSYSGTRAAYNRVTGADSSCDFCTSYATFSPSLTVYYSYMSRYVVTGDKYVVFKNGRINASPNHYNGAGTTYFSNNSSDWYSDATTSGGVEWHSGLNSPSWTRHEIYREDSDPGVANGRVTMSIGNTVVRDNTNVVTRTSAQGSMYHDNIILGMMFANARNDGDHRAWIDDVYVDNTRARLELCTGSTWANRTSCNIQIPVDWSDTSIRATVNTSGFTSGQNAYLYVVDRNNVVSGGYPVVIDGVANNIILPPPQVFIE